MTNTFYQITLLLKVVGAVLAVFKSCINRIGLGSLYCYHNYLSFNAFKISETSTS